MDFEGRLHGFPVRGVKGQGDADFLLEKGNSPPKGRDLSVHQCSGVEIDIGGPCFLLVYSLVEKK
jgi:hypothetical protein